VKKACVVLLAAACALGAPLGGAIAFAQPGVVAHIDTIRDLRRIGNGVAVNPITKRVYVLTEDEDRAPLVTVIDSASNTLAGEIDLGYPQGVETHAIAVNAQTNRVYVVGTSMLTVIDAVSNAVIHSMPSSVRGVNIAVNEARNLLYLAGDRPDGSPVVQVIDAATNAYVDEFATGIQARAMDVNPTTNRLYVADDYKMWVLGNNAEGAFVFDTIPTLVRPQSLVVDATNDRIYLAGYEFFDNPVLMVIDGASPRTAQEVGLSVAYPVALAVHSDSQRIFVAGRGVDGISVLALLDATWYDTVESYRIDGEVISMGIDRRTAAIYLPAVAGTALTSRVTVMKEGASPAPSGNTTVGDHITVEPIDEATGTTAVSVTFASVLQRGETIVVTSSAATGQPDGYKHGNPPLSFTAQTSAQYTGPVVTCVRWQEGQFQNEATTRMFHLQEGWVDVTTSRDTLGNQICGQVASLEHSSFFVFEEGYRFSGFYWPVSSSPTLNTMKAGAIVPIMFSLNGNQGLNIFKDGSPFSLEMNCDTNEPLAVMTPTLTFADIGLQYSALADTYIYLWKSDKAWANTCRRFVMPLSDGTVKAAQFRFVP
jgi:DNA-binding beta-propeller fold protein YncE